MKPIVVIAILILVVLLLLRRKSKDTGDAGAGVEEFTEETITTLTDEKTGDDGEWSNTTEDNPLFATENYEDDPFTNAFEEVGFFRE